ncbi:hypothetical protein [Natronospira bacteriovora]|uniref:Uncharacterized protein n=1 Tax=Natronospira bacteriovora TaxID=3069753 RepID=A0ABU0W8V7_9GAMM|nr:hypothetical protein [Natronospira sp. AB-CW4]MDQ2070334.1 hypothetical protein [Natronospira sp. AB-CW4]
MMGQQRIRQPEDLGRTGSLLYALNTPGDVSGDSQSRTPPASW